MNDLDEAWEAVNYLGGGARPTNEYERGFGEALDKALLEIERLGGMSLYDRDATEKYRRRA